MVLKTKSARRRNNEDMRFRRGKLGYRFNHSFKAGRAHPNPWSYNPHQAAKLSETRENPTLLPGAVLPADILITHNLGDALTGAEGVVMAVPSQTVRSTCWAASSFIDRTTWVVCAAKGLEDTTHLRMSEVLKQNLTNNPSIAVLSGPSHAEEVLKIMPTTCLLYTSPSPRD